MNTKKLLILSFFVILISLSPYSQPVLWANDPAKIEEIKKQLQQSQEMLDKIEEHIKSPDITDNELSIYRQELKEADNYLVNSSEYFKTELSNDKNVLSDLTTLGLNDNTLKDTDNKEMTFRIKEIYTKIDEYSAILIQLRLISGQISDTINAISDKKIRIRSRDLFIYNLPFYRAEAWISGKNDIVNYLSSMKNSFPSFKDSILKAGFKICFAFMLLLVGLLAFLSYRFSARYKEVLFSKTIKKGHMEITKYGDIFSSRGFITLMIFFKNAVLPSLLLLLLERSFHMNYGYESTNGWFLLIWNITTTIVFIFSMHTIVNILFDKRIGYLPETFIESVKFKRRCIIIVYQIALLFTLNDINIMDIAISINPIFSINGTALLNLIFGLTISYNIFILAPKIKQYFLSSKTKIKHAKFFISLINLFILVALATPIMVFLGASNFFIGLVQNLTQCFLTLFFFCIAYSILSNIHPILSRNIAEFFYRASAETDEDEEKFSHIDHKTPIFTYWLNFLILAVFSIITAILFHL